MHALGRLWLLIHEIRQRFRRRIGQPFIDADSIAAGLGNLVPVRIQEQFITEMLGRFVPQNPANAVVDRRVGRMIFAVHFKVDLKGRPARTKVRFPLQFHVATGDRQRSFPRPLRCQR